MPRTADEKRLLKAIRTMPFAPDVRVESLETAFATNAEITIAHVADYLVSLADALRAELRRQRAMEGELDNLKADLSAAGRLLVRMKQTEDAPESA